MSVCQIIIIFGLLSKSINIISFDVPFPANYGGVIDVYYKLVWLKKLGIRIHLHCFTYGRTPAKELEELCEKVYYYERKTGLTANFSMLPYTVKSRQSAELEKNLLSNNFPILFEVLHTCYLLDDPRFKTRKKIYRHSNIEHEYYKELAKSEKSFLKRFYLKIETFKLKKFEGILKHANLILAVNQKDTEYFKKTYASVQTQYLPSFHPNEQVNIKEGRGNFVLFHGNLSVSENYEAVLWLLEHVFSQIKHKVVIAGLNPPHFLQEKINGCKNIQLLANPPAEQMDGLMQNAQVQALYTKQATGLKLKLLNACFGGRFIVCNTQLLSGTGLEAGKTLFVDDMAETFSKRINELMQKEFNAELIEERKNMMQRFSNAQNAATLTEAVFHEKIV